MGCVITQLIKLAITAAVPLIRAIQYALFSLLFLSNLNIKPSKLLLSSYIGKNTPENGTSLINDIFKPVKKPLYPSY